MPAWPGTSAADTPSPPAPPGPAGRVHPERDERGVDRLASRTGPSRDRALASVPGIAAFDVTLAEIKDGLPKLRGVFDASMAALGGGLASLSTISADYGRFADLASTAEQTLAHRLGRGAGGTGSPRLLARIRSFEAVSVVVASQARRTGVFFDGLVVGSPPAAVREEFAAESKRYEVFSAQLDTELDPQTAHAWHRMTSAEEFRLIDAAMAKGVSALPGVSTLVGSGQLDLSAVLQFLPSARAAMAVVSQLSAFLQRMAHDTAALARVESAGARRYAVVSLCGTGLAIVITVIALFVVGGVLRRRLSRLAEAAQRLSAGYLEPTAVRGPRELAALSEALNAAGTTLQHVQAKAQLLASGDLDSPDSATAPPSASCSSTWTVSNSATTGSAMMPVITRYALPHNGYVTRYGRGTPSAGSRRRVHRHRRGGTSRPRHGPVR